MVHANDFMLNAHDPTHFATQHKEAAMLKDFFPFPRPYRRFSRRC